MATEIIQGMASLQKAISEMNDKVKKEILKKGFTEASKPLIQQAKENIDSKRIQKSLGVMITKSDTAMVGARIGKKYAGFMAPWFEEGTKERSYKPKSKGIFKKSKGVHRTGRMRPTRFWSKAVESSEKQVFENIYNVFTNVMEKIIGKYTK